MAPGSKSKSRSPVRREYRRSRSRSRERHSRAERDRRGGHKSSKRERHRSRSPRPRRSSRSRSPVRRRSPYARVRSRSGSPRAARAGGRPRSRSRSRGRVRSPPRGRRSRSGSSDSREASNADEVVYVQEQKELTEAEMKDKTEDEIEMMRFMGFSGFESTKGKHVPGNNVSAVNIIHKRKYRQYMNRKGGFNRPLDFVA